MSKRRAFPSRATRFDAKTLERDLHRRQPGGRPIDVVRRHARLTSTGVPMRCTASQRERGTDDPWELHSIGKVIFDDVNAAAACVRELRNIYPNVARYVYPCRRSRHGHVHLTTHWSSVVIAEVK